VPILQGTLRFLPYNRGEQFALRIASGELSLTGLGPDAMAKFRDTPGGPPLFRQLFIGVIFDDFFCQLLF
jgi:hypothetical protein